MIIYSAFFFAIPSLFFAASPKGEITSFNYKDRNYKEHSYNNAQ
jgi:hypothetical protein